MANVYTFNPNKPKEEFDKDNNNYQIPSVAYTNSLFKKLTDAIEDHMNDPIAHQSCLTREKLNINMSESIDICELELDVEKSKQPSHAKDINTDSSHRFVSDTEMNILKSKPSIADMQNAIMDLRNELKSLIDSTYNDLLNTPNTLQKLKDITYMLKANPDVVQLTSKITREEFKEHTNSDLHLNDEKNRILDILMDLIKVGCADWNAPKDSPSYINNKPKSLLANGGNADTISGYSVDDLINRQHEEYIFAIENNNNSSLSIEYADEILKPDEDISNYIDSIRLDEHKGLWCFKTGKYHFHNLNFAMTSNDSDYGYTIKGANNHNTVFDGDTANIASRVTIKDLGISNASVTIGSLCTLYNVYFTNCKVQFNECTEAMITNCIFENCEILFTNACMHTIITGNRFKNSGYPKYYNNTNIINNNLFY